MQTINKVVIGIFCLGLLGANTGRSEAQSNVAQVKGSTPVKQVAPTTPGKNITFSPQPAQTSTDSSAANAVKPPAANKEIFLNGVKVTGLRNQFFGDCQVNFDANGNVLITAKDYIVEQAEQIDASATGKKSSQQANKQQRIFLLTMFNRPGVVQYDVSIFVNGRFVRKVGQHDKQQVIDISDFFVKGKNLLYIYANKTVTPDQPRLSNSPNDYLRVIIGQGKKGSDAVNVEDTLVELKVTADKSDSFGREYVLETP